MILDNEEFIKVFLTLRIFYYRLYDSQSEHEHGNNHRILIASGLDVKGNSYTKSINKLYEVIEMLLRFAKISKKIKT